MKSDYKVFLAALLVFIGLAGCLFLFDGKTHPTSQPSPSTDDTLSATDDDTTEPLPPTAHLQPFDPNTADADLLRDVGLSDFLVRSILRYRAKGGVYSSPEDFARVPGLTQGQYKKLLPYISIADDFRPAAELVGPRRYDTPAATRDTTAYPVKINANERISINDADTNALKRVPGIGSYYARKIVELRKRYGGFVSLTQLSDIRGLGDECYQYLTVPDGGVTKININTADFRTLQAHPYIGYYRARKISDYRRLKGKITSLSQLSLLQGFSEEERRRLEPYIEF